MTASAISEAKAQFEARLREWAASQENQTDGYAYEASFVAMMQQVRTETFQTAMGSVPSNKNKKKR